jgi:hypothetical protein
MNFPMMNEKKATPEICTNIPKILSGDEMGNKSPYPIVVRVVRIK